MLLLTGTRCHLILLSMTKMVQVRNVPDAIHKRLKAKAASLGLSLSEFLLPQLKQAAEKPTLEELRHRLDQRDPIQPSVPAAEILRRERNAAK